MSIKIKLSILGGVTLLTLITLFLLGHYQSNVTHRINEAAFKVQGLERDMLLLRRHEKDFLARQDLKYQQHFTQTFNALNENLSTLTSQMQALDLSTAKVDRLQQVFTDYQNAFNKLVSTQVEMGLSPKEGLYGKLRQTVHDAEEVVNQQRDSALLASILMLRRAEKDFMLRQDTKYLDKFEGALAAAFAGMEMSRLTDLSKRKVSEKLNSYADDFRSLVKKSVQIGLSHKEGLLGEMRQTVHQSETLMAETDKHLQEALVARKTTLERISLSGFLATAMVLLAMLTAITRAILKPVQQLSAHMREISHTHNLSLRAELKGNDELSRMGDDFNLMLASFQNTVKEVLGSSDQMSAAAEELSAITAQTSNGISQQRQDIEQVAAALYQMGSTLEEVASNTEMAATSAQEADRKASHGIEVVDKSIQRVYSMAEHAKRAASVVAELEQKSSDISNVLEVIKVIAEQTNLLALNAAIEAARAGEQGRGFAVVADEVRGLAQRTQASAVEIEAMIASLQTGTQDVVGVIQESAKIADESVEHARDASASLNDIMSSISQILSMSTQIAAATEEQATVANDINKNLSNIKNVTEESSLAAERSATAGCQVAQQAHRLHDSVQLFTA